jgi:hypothetical protein
VSAIAERCAALVPPAARSYSGAVPCDTWAWRATPYVGASDHAMLAGPPTSCPTVSLGHWPDNANHTDADVPDLVDPFELRRTATIAGATIAALRSDDAELAADVRDATLAWAAGYVLSAMPGARPQPPAPPERGPSLDPWAPEHTGRLLAHRGSVARAVVRSLPTPGHAPAWIEQVTSLAVASTAAAVAEPPVGLVAEQSVGLVAEPPVEPEDGHVLSARWLGPMNLRHVAERADPADRRWLSDLTTHDRGGSYARLLALARGIDGRRDGRAVAWWAAMASGLAIPVADARRFLGILCRTGLAQPSTSQGR